MLKNFANCLTVKELKSENFDWNNIPRTKGVYVVVYNSANSPTFLSKGSGGFFKKKDSNVLIERLKQKWIEFKSGDDNIVYIGKAGGGETKETLKRRVKAYIRFGSGKSTPHRGGRYIWQIASPDSLKIYWREVNDPIIEEKKMLLEFRDKHSNRLPFANLRM